MAAPDLGKLALKGTTTAPALVLQFINSTYDKISSPPRGYISRELCNELNIRCCELDFNTGQPSNGQEKFIDLLPYEMFETLRDKIWGNQPLTMLSDQGEGPMEHARQIWNALAFYLTSNSKNDIYAESLHIYHMASGWERHEPSDKLFIEDCSEETGFLYEAKSIVEALYVRAEESPHTACPHIVCLLADRSELKEDELSMAEMNCVWLLSKRQASSPKYKQHCVFPITILSGSGFKVRILQAYIDIQPCKNGESPCVNVRKTKIIDFGTGRNALNANSEQFFTLLRWVMGSPNGKTVLSNMDLELVSSEPIST